MWLNRRPLGLRLAAVAGLGGAFGRVSVAVDHLEVRHAPETEELRPRQLAVLAPDPEQRHAVVDLGSLEQAFAALPAAPLLQAPQQAHVIARRAPEIPGDDARGVPRGVTVGPRAPQIDMPPKPVDRLAAHAAEARPAGKPALPIGSWRKPEGLG